ncbi:hypothetical protein DIPPA_27670 [Diplonema papillatum]|nr:hypothetical protein DIPPA_07237 [Diplonema papillatum]KAJ9437880.1 hypothetical protein DIPPA_06337 [Diplonema papillatum]KAJ9445049.1 hypothetical protein DIPPA_27670 [Diplonema papillatum]
MPAKGPKRKREESEETSSDEDSADSLMPQKSKQRYTDVWKDFLAYIREHHNYPRSVTTTRKPNETQYSGYIKALRNERGLAATTIWSYFSMLTTKHTTLYGENPAKKFPRLVQRLKTYSKDHVSKKAMPFTPEQVDEFMKRETECSVEDTQTKALVALAYFGGLRCAELRGINMADVRLATSSGKKTVVVNYQGLKSTAEQGQRCFSKGASQPRVMKPP